jgi:hypothetical protein
LSDFITGVPQGPQKDKKFRVRALLKCTYEFINRKKGNHSRILVKEEINLPVQDEY